MILICSFLCFYGTSTTKYHKWATKYATFTYFITIFADEIETSKYK